jgi:hypothetical protein
MSATTNGRGSTHPDNRQPAIDSYSTRLGLNWCGRLVTQTPTGSAGCMSINRMLRLIASLGSAALLCGCAGAAASMSAGSSLLTLPGATSLDIRENTDVRLSEGNFVLVKTNVVGECRGFALLGLITIVSPQFNTAAGRLYGNAAMQPGKPQTLANIMMERTSSYWILFSIPKWSIRADVIEFFPGKGAKDDAGPALK